MKKILLVFGTRPEAIKMAPIVKALKKSSQFDVKVLLTAQHREMLDQVMVFFGLESDFDLNIMRSGQSLFDVTSAVLSGVGEIVGSEKPDLVLVHGDTTTSSAASLAAFYHQVPVGHVEAGLRTGDIYSPFPEEMNRRLTGRMATYHFAPTNQAKVNLLAEGVDDNSVVVTGNTVIDALYDGLSIVKEKQREYPIDQIVKSYAKKIILVTGHRRENFGQGFLNICESLRSIAQKYSDVDIVYPVHLNPNVQKPVHELLSEFDNIHLVKPYDYEEFLYVMERSYIILTDSGGIQEEAPSLGKPVLVMRDTTERPEAVEAGTVKLVGTDIKQIISSVSELLEDDRVYTEMSKAHNPYGDGKASERICEFLELKLRMRKIDGV